MRIISGELRHRRILSPPGLTTRPIPDRVKLALFNILAGRLEQATVLDLYCGTGSMGLEALSRGARLCAFAERDRAALGLLRQNIQTFGLEDRSRVWAGDILTCLGGWLAELPGEADIAFVDPPYSDPAAWDWAQVGGELFDPLAGRLARDGIIMLRCQRNILPPEALGMLKLRDRRDYGGMSLIFWQRRN
jgi:16S rRNA (guanine966-N2)-methyltransferase